MFLVGLISWWYGRGWTQQWAHTVARFKATLDFFSVGQLMSTLFEPFRQISASPGGDGSFGAAMRGFVDKLISRLIGAFLRFFTILFGLIVMLFQAVLMGIVLIVWWVIPLLPVVGLILYAIGWIPSWT